MIFRKILSKIPIKKRFDLYLDKFVRRMLIDEISYYVKGSEWRSAIESEREYLIKNIYKNIAFKCYLDCKLSKLIYLDKFELDEMDFVKKVLKRGDVFVDVGANTGIFTLIAAKIVGETGKVISFEPTSNTYARLQDNIALNQLQNVDTFQIALSNAEKTELLNVSDEGFDAWNSLSKPSSGTNYHQETISTNTFDNLLPMIDRLYTAKLVKIDVEGWESMVLVGAYEFLSNSAAPVLMIEFTEQNAKNAGTNTEELYSRVVNLGYKLYSYNSLKNELIPEPYSGPYEYKNLIAIKNFELVNVESWINS